MGLVVKNYPVLGSSDRPIDIHQIVNSTDGQKWYLSSIRECGSKLAAGYQETILWQSVAAGEGGSVAILLDHIDGLTLFWRGRELVPTGRQNSAFPEMITFLFDHD